MKIYQYTLLAMSLFSTLASFAQNEQSEQIQEQSIAPTNLDNQFKDESASNRVNKKFSLMLSAGIGFGDQGNGILGGYFLDPNSIIEAEYFTSEDDSKEDVLNGYKYSSTNFKQETDSLNVSLKYFLANSFYIKPGLFYVDYRYVTKGYFFGDADIKRKDLGMSFSIGNQWQWQNFTLGCDWFGIQSGVVNLSKSGEDNTIFSDLEGRTQDKTWLTATLLKLNIGASF